jgi:hypothetical protein
VTIKAAVVQSLTIIAQAFELPPAKPERIATYAMVLEAQGYSAEQIALATNRLLLEHRRDRLPYIADYVAVIDRTEDDAAEQWERLGTPDPRCQLPPATPLARRVERILWGTSGIQPLQVGDLPHARKMFLESYTRHRRQEAARPPMRLEAPAAPPALAAPAYYPPVPAGVCDVCRGSGTATVEVPHQGCRPGDPCCYCRDSEFLAAVRAREVRR